MAKEFDSAWLPSKDVLHHTGSAIRPNAVFFVAPPPEIGRVISADSTLTNPPSSSFKKIALWISLIGLLTAVLVSVRTWSLWPMPIVLVMTLAVLAVVAFCISYRCSFVGERGIAIAAVKQLRQSAPKEDVLLFEDATTLDSRQTSNYVNGRYTGTNHKYQWTRKGQSDFVIEGGHDKKGALGSGHPLSSAQAAENAWTQHLWPIACEDFRALGHVDFPMTIDIQMIRVEKDTLVFSLKNGKTHTASADDIVNLSLSSGFFQLQHKDATWWSGKGQCSFGINAIPNSKLFILCLQQFVGFGLTPT